MLDYFVPSLHIGVAPGRVTALRTLGWRRGTTLIADVAIASPTSPNLLPLTLHEALNTAPYKRGVARIVLADQCVRYFSVVPPKNLLHLQDCHAAAAIRFQTLYGESPSDWQLHGDWNSRDPFLVCAIPLALQRSLQEIMSEHKLTLMSSMPHFIAAWNRHRRSLAVGQWFGVLHEHALTLGVVTKDRLCAVRTILLPDDAFQPHWLSDQVAREALRLDLAVPTTINLCGDVPAAWLASQGPLNCRRLDEKVHSIQQLPNSSGIRLASAGLR